MPGRLFLCFPTRLLAWLDCPRRYRFSYLDRPQPPKGPAWAHNSVGASVHNALRDWWLLDPRRRRPAEARRLVERGWIDQGFRDVEQSAAWRERAADMVERYVAGLDAGTEPLGVERTVSFRTRRLVVSGRVDRIDSRGADAVVVDYKTGRRVLGVDDVRGSLALALYACGVERTLRRRVRTVELHHLPTATVSSYEHTEASLARQVARAEALASEAVAAERQLAADPARAAAADVLFPARPGPRCGWCDYVAHCVEGARVAVARKPWDGLAEDRAAPAEEAPPEQA
jgi:hypothetical protein